MKKYQSPIFCNHANECPSGPSGPSGKCDCNDDCSCRELMCVKNELAVNKSDFKSSYLENKKEMIMILGLIKTFFSRVLSVGIRKTVIKETK